MLPIPGGQSSVALPLLSVFLGVPNTASWKLPIQATIPVRKVHNYEKIAPELVRLNDQGMRVEALAAAHGMSTEYMAQILNFGRTGIRQQWRPADKAVTTPIRKTNGRSTARQFGNRLSAR